MSDMPLPRTQTPPRPRVIVAMNALRFGGSQTFAASLASRLTACGFEVAIVAKRGEHSATFEESWRVEHVLWAEGVGAARGLKQSIAHWAGYASIARLVYALRDNPPIAWIASQPWPIHYAVATKRFAWPDAPRIGLMHGTTEVEVPPPGGARELAALDRLYMSTHEGEAALKERYGLQAVSIGNLFDADAYWGRRRLVAASSDPACSRVLFLGTLTPNKVSPLWALLELAAGEPALDVVVVGDGPERAGLEDLARRSTGDRVRFAGGLLDPRTEIERADVVVAAGRAAIEAASRPSRVIVANGDGVFGALSPVRLDLCRRYNFTGRAPGSGPATAAEMARAIKEAAAISATELAANASELTLLGDLDPLVEFLRSQSARMNGAASQRDL